jgi:hypothetical protein
MKYLIAFIVLFISIEVSAQYSRSYRAGIGISIGKNFVVGLQDNFRHRTQGNDKMASFSNTVGPFIRYNIPLGRFAVFPQVSAGLGTVSNIKYVLDWTSGQAIARKSNTVMTEYLASIGATYFLTRSVGIETLLDFDIQKKRPALELGLQFYLRKQKVQVR